jgi:hypothetical protein
MLERARGFADPSGGFSFSYGVVVAEAGLMLAPTASTG